VRFALCMCSARCLQRKQARGNVRQRSQDVDSNSVASDTRNGVRKVRFAFCVRAVLTAYRESSPIERDPWRSAQGMHTAARLPSTEGNEAQARETTTSVPSFRHFEFLARSYSVPTNFDTPYLVHTICFDVREKKESAVCHTCRTDAPEFLSTYSGPNKCAIVRRSTNEI